MTTPSPADRFRAAAQKVRDLADKATPGPWAYQGAFGTGFVYPSDAPAEQTVAQAWIVRAREHNARFADARWIAALSPAVAEPLATLLAHLAEAAEVLQRTADAGRTSLRLKDFEGITAALALADALGVAGGETT